MNNKRLFILNILTLLAFITVVVIGVSKTAPDSDVKPVKDIEEKADKNDEHVAPLEVSIDSKMLAPTYDYEYKKSEAAKAPYFSLTLDPNDTTSELDVSEEIEEEEAPVEEVESTVEEDAVKEIENEPTSSNEVPSTSTPSTKSNGSGQATNENKGKTNSNAKKDKVIKTPRPIPNKPKDKNKVVVPKDPISPVMPSIEPPNLGDGKGDDSDKKVQDTEDEGSTDSESEIGEGTSIERK